MASQAARRDSRGWVESRGGLVVLVVLVVEECVGGTGPRPWRNVSWRPGAEGALGVVWERWEWEVECEEGGAMRIACWREVRLGYEMERMRLIM